jgi:hypothetical protein
MIAPLASAFAVALVVTAGAQDDASKLNGTWVLVRGEQDGKPAAPAIRVVLGASTPYPPYFTDPVLSAMNTSLRGNLSNRDAGLPKFVASTSSGLPAIHSERSISS